MRVEKPLQINYCFEHILYDFGTLLFLNRINVLETLPAGYQYSLIWPEFPKFN